MKNKNPAMFAVLLAGLLIVAPVLLVSGCSSRYGSVNAAGKDGKSFIVNIDAKTSTRKNPVSVELSAGKYTIEAIGKTEGGEYDSWKAWIHKPRKNREGVYTIGWLNTYYYSSDEFEEIKVTDGVRYRNAEQALQHAQKSTFELENNGIIHFYIGDPMSFDNKGGMSLLVTRG